jgi:FAD/FMN-containing dehydrogenase
VTIIEELRELLGDGGVLDAAEAARRAAGVWQTDGIRALGIARPRSTQEVAAVMRLCHGHHIPVVTHGGLTGLVHGADAQPDQLVLSLERMRSIESIDPVQRVATVQAGVTLQALQEAVGEQGLAFPLDLGARGTATLGGNAATNAGGNRVIRYGMMRDMVLGLEVVLADGEVISALNPLIKNNTGYDLKQLFIGSEGTLGVITRLVLRLRELPASTNMALLAVDSFDKVPALLKAMDRGLGGSLSAFEVMWRDFYRLVTTPPAAGNPPLGDDWPYYILVEAQGANAELDSARFEAALEQALEQELIADAVLARSGADCERLWALRDDVEQTFRHGAPVVFDVSLPSAGMEAYIEGLRADLEAALGEHHLWVFGHLGDGNLHVVVQTADGRASASRPTIESIVYQPLAAIGGSVSAEHGIGLEKKPYLTLSRSGPELALMRRLKQALDPTGILNPGKILD